MQQQESRETQFSAGLMAGTAVAILILGGAGSFLAWNLLSKGNDPSNPTPTQPQEPPTTGSSAGERPIAAASEVEIYGLAPTETSFDLIAKAMPVESGTTEREAIDGALTALLAEKSDAAEFVSTIPDGTKLLGVEIESDGNIRVDLSGEFASGGGSASMIGRVAQVLYTATSLDPEAGVWFELDGEPMESIGGEGLVLDGPLTRADFQSEFEL